MLRFTLKHSFIAGTLIPQIILQSLFHEHATSNRINGFLVHLLDILDERAQWDLVCWCDPTNVRNHTKMSHLLDCLGNFTMS